MKKRIILSLISLLLLALCLCAQAEGEYRMLENGVYGDDVLALKGRLAELGYFSGSNFNNRYTNDTVARVKAFEKACGLPETGIATPALQTLIFSDDAVSKKTGETISGDAPFLPDIAASIYRNIGPDCSGDDVLALKKKLAKLDFFNAKAETANYNNTMGDAIRDYQRSIGEEVTGVCTPAQQAQLFESELYTETPKPSEVNREARENRTVKPQETPKPVKKAAVTHAPNRYPLTPTATPKGTIKPTSTPRIPTQEVVLPALSEQGFLMDKNAEPFVHADRDDGHWYYISDDLYIEIVRKYTPRQNITWFETEVRCTPDSLPRTLLAKGSREDGHNFVSPKVIGEQYDPILAISDDFYGHRWYNSIKQGVIIRNGRVISEDTYPASSRKWPYLEVIALFSDGSMQVFESDEYTAQEYLDMGVTDTMAFGPILVRDGIVDKSLYDKDNLRYTDDEPRMAIGCIEPYHYMIVTAKGRTQDSDGVTMHWLAERMLYLGCDQALNLDGGNTVALYFMGDVLNKIVNSTSYRDISSMFGFVAD